MLEASNIPGAVQTSRKMLFAGGLLPVLECASLRREEMPTFLGERLRWPPTDRVAQAFLDAGAHDAGGRTLGAYDEFIGLLHQKEFRDALESLPREEADTSVEFNHVRRLGKDLQRGLLALLFETDPLARVFREYAIF